MSVEFKLPELGENITKASVVRVLVKEGDTIRKEQPVLEIETDKAALEVPATVGGKVLKVHVKEGTDASVGETVLTLEGDGEAGQEQKQPETPPKADPPEPKAKPEGEKKKAAPGPEEKKPEAAPPAVAAEADYQPGVSAPASPSVRRLAREIGVPIALVKGTGPGGRISEADVKAHAKAAAQARPAAGAPVAAPEPAPDFSRYGPIEVKPASKIRRLIAERLSFAWSAIPHVHHRDKADITGLEELRKRYNDGEGRQAGLKLTTTAFLIRLVAAALKLHPRFCASLSPNGEEIIFKRYCHIGVAVDTDRGLLVPVLRDADRKGVAQIQRELDDLAERARQAKLTPDEMRGGCFTLSNLGGIGGASFDPIINHPEVAILGVARAAQELVVREGEPTVRLMLPLSLGYDHRVIDGADGARFMRDLCAMISDPYSLLLYA